MTVYWYPEAMTARLKAAMIPAAQELARQAQARAPGAIKVTSSVSYPIAKLSSPNPEAVFVESGVRPHTITPRGNVLRLADGRFVTGAVSHPGQRAQPFLHPVLPQWPATYRRYAMGAMHV